MNSGLCCILPLLLTAIVAVCWGAVVVHNDLSQDLERLTNARNHISVEYNRCYSQILALRGFLPEHRQGELDAIAAAMQAEASTRAAGRWPAAMQGVQVIGRSYPQLKLVEDSRVLLSEIHRAPATISAAIKNYNDLVLVYNSKLRRFPASMMGGILGYRAYRYRDGMPTNF
jgi:hypothetical protein